MILLEAVLHRNNLTVRRNIREADTLTLFFEQKICHAPKTGGKSVRRLTQRLPPGAAHHPYTFHTHPEPSGSGRGQVFFSSLKIRRFHIFSVTLQTCRKSGPNRSAKGQSHRTAAGPHESEKQFSWRIPKGQLPAKDSAGTPTPACSTERTGHKKKQIIPWQLSSSKK